MDETCRLRRGEGYGVCDDETGLGDDELVAAAVVTGHKKHLSLDSFLPLPLGSDSGSMSGGGVSIPTGALPICCTAWGWEAFSGGDSLDGLFGLKTGIKKTANFLRVQPVNGQFFDVLLCKKEYKCCTLLKTLSDYPFEISRVVTSY